ncbi:MAG TPA: hypothetical protein VGD40_23270 [Chryseosolibacter sp.]
MKAQKTWRAIEELDNHASKKLQSDTGKSFREQLTPTCDKLSTTRALPVQHNSELYLSDQSFLRSVSNFLIPKLIKSATDITMWLIW